MRKRLHEFLIPIRRLNIEFLMFHVPGLAKTRGCQWPADAPSVVVRNR
jgi:hypothetical protein